MMLIVIRNTVFTLQYSILSFTHRVILKSLRLNW